MAETGVADPHTLRPGAEALLIVPLAVLSAAFVLLATGQGIGATPDSVTYLDAAETLARTGQFVDATSGAPVTITSHPPLYSIFLAAGELLGIRAALAARILNAVSLGLMVLAASAVGRSAAGPAAGVTTAVLFATSPHLLKAASFAWSESLFVLFLVTWCAVMGRACRSLAWPWLLLAALLAGLASCVRFVGGVASITGLLVVAVVWKSHRLAAIAIYGVVSLGPLAALLLRNRLQEIPGTGRGFSFHPPTAAMLASAFDTVWTYMPGTFEHTVPFRYFAALLGILLAILLFFVIHQLRLDRFDVLNTPVLFTVLYPAALFASITFYDASSGFDDRLMLPAYATGLLALTASAWRSASSRLRYSMFGLMIAAAVVAYTSASIAWVRSARSEGLGYSHRLWRESAVIERLRRVPANSVVVSNGCDAVVFLTGRKCLPLPWKVNPHTHAPNMRWREDVQSLLRGRLDGDVLAWFDRLSWREYLPTERELQLAVAAPALKLADGKIFPLGAATRAQRSVVGSDVRR